MAPRKFKPLGQNAKASDEDTALAGIVFDMDGTLSFFSIETVEQVFNRTFRLMGSNVQGEPQNYMFAEMRAALRITKATDILEHIESLPASDKVTAMRSVQEIEKRAMAAQKAQPGLLTLMEYLQLTGIPKAICTRNFDMPVTHLLTKFLSEHLFEPVLTREFKPPKPDPAGILHIAESWGVSQNTDKQLPLIMVGDSIDDMTAGHKAGAATVLLVNKDNSHLVQHEHTDLCISQLDGLIDVLDRGFVGTERSGL